MKSPRGCFSPSETIRVRDIEPIPDAANIAGTTAKTLSWAVDGERGILLYSKNTYMGGQPKAAGVVQGQIIYPVGCQPADRIDDLTKITDGVEDDNAAALGGEGSASSRQNDGAGGAGFEQQVPGGRRGD